MVILLILTLVGISNGANIQKREICGYAKISADHTMCISNDIGTDVPVDDTVKKEIIDLHNKLRAGVKPSAGRMIELIWDDELALIAAKWARQCVFGHDENVNRRTKAYPSISIGQNGAFDSTSWSQAINRWYSEVESFAYGQGSVDGKTVGHYTQVVNENAVRIGCGEATCPEGSSPDFKERALFCNYGRGQLSSEIKRPYILNNPCEDCPGHCDEALKLCYCDGRLCENGGLMQYDTCTCNCTALYKGQVCSEIDCKPDKDICPLYKDEWCGIYANVPQECPNKCKKC